MDQADRLTDAEPDHNRRKGVVMRPPTRQSSRVTGTTATAYQAVQEDTAVTCVDWQPSHAWTDHDTDFTGQISITGRDPAIPVATAPWSTPTDEAADHALERLGWHRTGPWNTDPAGRRTATVTPHPAATSWPHIFQDQSN